MVKSIARKAVIIMIKEAYSAALLVLLGVTSYIFLIPFQKIAFLIKMSLKLFAIGGIISSLYYYTIRRKDVKSQ